MNDDHISYCIDQHDTIVSASDAWDAFARDNGAAELTAHSVLGQPLFDYIVDSGTREIYRTLLARCRSENSVLSFPFRCDSPGLRRFMRMEMRPTVDSGVLFDSRVERVESRDVVALLDSQATHNDQVVLSCSWCNRFKLDDDTWVEAEHAVTALQLFDKPRVPNLSHGICADCFESLRTQRVVEG